MLKVDHIYKTFNPGTINEKTALNGTTLTLNEGDFVTVIGGNGAGKSTTIHILCTLLKATAGTVKICDYDALKEADAIRNKIGVVFQNNTLDDYLTVKENLLMRGFLYEKDLKTVQKNLLF